MRRAVDLEKGSRSSGRLLGQGSLGRAQGRVVWATRAMEAWEGLFLRDHPRDQPLERYQAQNGTQDPPGGVHAGPSSVYGTDPCTRQGSTGG